MAKRIVFYVEDKQFKRKSINFQWFPGFAKVQVQRSIQSLHQNFKKLHPAAKILEISSASPTNFAAQASAFNLTIHTKKNNYTVEQIFQAGKYFKKNGSQQRLLNVSSKVAKKEISELNKHDQLDHFEIFGQKFPLEPKTFFYNWIYIGVLYRQHKQLAQKILQYDAFTDIYFNDQKSFNCQAEACSIYIALFRQGKLDKALESQKNFLQMVYNLSNSQQKKLLNNYHYFK